jgi:Flp pilus assembly protein TadD
MKKTINVVVGAVLILLLLSACSDRDEPPVAPVVESLPPATFIGKDACLQCHESETESWTGSHHDLAMQHANEGTILGDFNDVEFDNYGVTSRFYRRDGEFWVETDGSDGSLQEFKVAYAFGVDPLQQYLIEFDRGRIQALPIAWDIVANRWFHLYPDEHIDFTDPLHWTGREQNWNYMCAECHSTNLQKNYTVSTESFETSWSEINVSCEACHGPASNHVAYAERGLTDQAVSAIEALDDRGGAAWQMNEETGIAERVPPLMAPPQQPEACGRCHARRGLATGDYQHGQPLLDTHTVSLLQDPLYFADGQIHEEVYVYGSFLQSKMYRAGVTCSDCHDAHSATLRASGAVSNVCSSCHLPARFNTEMHHQHATDDVECVDCHMPSRNFMVVDGRRDHSFRIPRPDLTPLTGAPNACNQCHNDQEAEWAAAALLEWNGEPDADHYSLAIHAGRFASQGANEALIRVATDASQSGIVRATTWALLEPPLTPDQMEAIRSGLADADPLVRIGAIRALRTMPPEAQTSWGAPLLNDRIRSVRMAATDLLSPLRESLPDSFIASFEKAEKEYIQSQLAIAERPEAMGNLATLFRERGDLEQSESYYKYALSMQPYLTSARVNLVDLYRTTGRAAEAEDLLREGLELNNDDAAVHHSLGLLLVSSGDPESVLKELRLAAVLQPGNGRFAYVYAVALNSYGRTEEAITALKNAMTRFPNDVDIGLAHVSFLLDSGQQQQARDALLVLLQRFPENRQVTEFAASLFGPRSLTRENGTQSVPQELQADDE